MCVGVGNGRASRRERAEFRRLAGSYKPRRTATLSRTADLLRRLLPLIALLPALSLASTTPGTTLRVRQDERTSGFSGALRVTFAAPGEVLLHALEFGALDSAGALYRWVPVHGTRGEATRLVSYDAGVTAPSTVGTWKLEVVVGDQTHATELTVLTTVSADQVKKGVLNGYRIGTYPAAGRNLPGDYTPPSAFIEITRENQDVYVSEHLQLKQFLTKNQADVWPKYLVLDLQLVDKLESVLQELNAMGYPAKRLHVMSGYRTPQYNGPGGKGRAKFSRHTYGDASDVWVDSDSDGYMDDLNQDGRRDVGDAQILVQAVERVEAKHPDLLGGAGVYKANRQHGPFVHIDARGRPARWSKR